MRRGSPQVPAGLVDICASGKAILFAGPGLGAQARLPTRQMALVHLLVKSDLSDILKDQLRAAIDAGEISSVTEVLNARLDRDAVIAELQVLYADDGRRLSEAHEILLKMPFSSVLTTGWDGLLERMFADRRPVILTGESDVAHAHRTDAFFLARLNGDLYERDSFIFSSDEYRRSLYERPEYAKFVASQILSHPLFFVGMSLSGIEEFFDAFRFPIGAGEARGYAVLPYAPRWETQQERFRLKYGLELIGYPVSEKHRELLKLLEKLGQ